MAAAAEGARHRADRITGILAAERNFERIAATVVEGDDHRAFQFAQQVDHAFTVAHVEVVSDKEFLRQPGVDEFPVEGEF